jgi:hypothetical protein
MLRRSGACNARKHRAIKRHTRHRLNLKHWDLGSLEEVTCNQIRELKRSFVKTGQLMQSQVRNAEDHKLLQSEHTGLTRDDFALSPHVRGEARLGDVVMHRNNAGEHLVGMLCLNYAPQLVQWSLVEAWGLKSVSGN